MQITDLTDEHKELFSLCLEDWSDDAKEAGPTRGCWVDRSQERGLRAKLALNDARPVAHHHESVATVASSHERERR